jgi:hypothetical protein
MTVACARCHNHKYDPITQKDYYALIGIFANSTYKEYPTVSEAQAAAYESDMAKLEKLQIDFQEYTRTETRQLADASPIKQQPTWWQRGTSSASPRAP